MHLFHKFILAWNSTCVGQFYKPVWHIPLWSEKWINSWWWTGKLSETCRVSCQNKFVKLVHLVGFIIKKFVTMYGHMNDKSIYIYRVSQEERTKLREGVPYVKLYRYNPKHLYPKLNGYGGNGQRSLKLWQLLHTYWLANTY